ncbi:hypothetical protein FVW20_00810, partial [Desulfovibrio oxamicus]|nr:hypothetical protein [Nitratidesulfovibrio oxamicus]
MTQSADQSAAISSVSPADAVTATAPTGSSATGPSVIGEDMAALAARQKAFVASGAVLPSGAR